MDINGEYPAPSNPAPGSPEALLQEVLNVAARDGGAWLKGRHIYYERTLQGATDQQAMYEAASAAAEGDANRIMQAMGRYNAFYYGSGNGSPSSTSRFSTILGVFGSRR